MYVSGMGVHAQAYFAFATMVIAVPTGVNVLLDCHHVGWLDPSSACRWCRASDSFSCLLIGGVTGVMIANAGVDRVLTDTYYIVAHFHYVMSLGAIFAIFASWYYWFPKMTGYMYNEALGKLHSG